MFNITQFREFIVLPTLGDLQIHTKELEELLIFTCATESQGGTYVHQIQGPALGIYQMQPATYSDLWSAYIIRKPDIVNLLALNFGVSRVPHPSLLVTDLRLATAICALYYKWKNARPASTSTEDLWAVYKPLYNTEKGKAEKDASIKLYNKFIK